MVSDAAHSCHNRRHHCHLSRACRYCTTELLTYMSLLCVLFPFLTTPHPHPHSHTPRALDSQFALKRPHETPAHTHALPLHHTTDSQINRDARPPPLKPPPPAPLLLCRVTAVFVFPVSLVRPAAADETVYLW